MKSPTLFILAAVLVVAYAYQPDINLHRPVERNSRILKGDEVEPHSIPYQVGIYIYTNRSETYFCGGSLISNRTVLTAAHCVESNYVWTVLGVEVILGAHRIFVQEDTQVRINISVSDIIFHPEYVAPSPYTNDIALLILPEAVELNENIQTVPLPDEDMGEYGVVTVSGWGYFIRYDDELSPVLRKANLSVIDHLSCLSSGGGSPPINPRVVPTLCLWPQGDQSPCDGDDGGPIVNENGVLLGVMSVDNCLPGSYLHETFLSKIVDFVKENMV